MEVVPKYRTTLQSDEEVIFTYDYFVEGKRYRSQRYSLGGNLRVRGIESLAQDFLATHEVFYNPTNPAESYIYPHLQLPKVVWPIFFLAAIGLSLLTWSVNAGFQRETHGIRSALKRNFTTWLGVSRLLLALAWSLLSLYLVVLFDDMDKPIFEWDPVYRAYNLVGEEDVEATRFYHLIVSPIAGDPQNRYYSTSIMEDLWMRTFLDEYIYENERVRKPIEKKIWKLYARPTHMKVQTLSENAEPTVIYEWTESGGLKRVYPAENQ